MEHNMDADNVGTESYMAIRKPVRIWYYTKFLSHPFSFQVIMVLQMQVTYWKKNSSLRSLRICESHKGILVVVTIIVMKKKQL